MRQIELNFQLSLCYSALIPLSENFSFIEFFPNEESHAAGHLPVNEKSFFSIQLPK